MKTELTQAERDLMHQVREEWIQHALTRKGQIDEEAFEEGIEWLYRDLLNLPKPKIVYCDSWLSCVLTIAEQKGYLNQIQTQIIDRVGDQIRNQVKDQVWNQVWDQVRNQIRDQITEQVEDQVRDEIRDQIEDQIENEIWNQIWIQVKNQVKDQVGNQVGRQIANRVWNQIWTQAKNQIEDQVWDQVDSQIWNQIVEQVWDQVRDQVGNRINNQIENHIWHQIRNQIGNRVGNQVDNQVKIRVWNQVNTQIGIQVEDQIWSQIRNQINNEIGDLVKDQVWDHIRTQVEDQVVDHIWNQIENQVGTQVGDEVKTQVGNQVMDQIWTQVRHQVSNQIWSEIRSNVGSQIADQIGNQVWSQIVNQVRNQVWDQALNQVKDQVMSIFKEYSTYIGYSNYSWVSFYDFFTRIGIINHEPFNKYLKLTKSGVFECYEYENVVFAIRPPVEIKKNEQGRLHSFDGPAVTNRDGSTYHFIHGVAIPTDLWEKLTTDTLTFEDFTQQKNEEVKAAILSYIEAKKGGEGIYRFVSDHLKEIDTYVDQKPKQYLKGTTGGMNIGVYTLFKGRVHDFNLAYVRCFCPSTDRMFFLSVHPRNTNAKDAIASLYRIPRKLSKHIKYIQRQGERFSTVFTETGRKTLKSLTKEELSDLVPISGEEYFGKMRYEY